MEPITALYLGLAATGGVGAGLFGKSLHTSSRLKNVEDKVGNLNANEEVRKLVANEVNKKT